MLRFLSGAETAVVNVRNGSILLKKVVVAIGTCAWRRPWTAFREATGLARAQVAGNGVGGVISLASLRRFCAVAP
jgi:hypothetical protein